MVRNFIMPLTRIAKAIQNIDPLSASAIANTLAVSRATSFRILKDARNPESDLNHVMQAVKMRSAKKGSKLKARKRY